MEDPKQVRAYEIARRKREIVLIVLTILGFTLLSFVERDLFFLVEKLNIPKDFFSKVFFLVIVNIDLILILILLFLIFRNLVKLIVERRRGKLGARLRTKLVVIFLLFSIIPTILLFYISTQFINNSIEKYFSSKIHKPLDEVRIVTQYYYDDALNHLKKSAQKFSKEMTAYKYLISAKNKKFMYIFNKFRDSNGLSFSRIYLKNDKTTITSRIRKGAQIPKEALSVSDLEGVEAGMLGKSYDTILKVGAGELLIHYEPIKMYKNESETIGTLVVYNYSRYNWADNLNRIEDVFSSLKPGKGVIRSGYFVLLVLMTLLILFSATWLGFYLAKEMTIPIQELAEATDQVAEGNLDFKINIKAQDEVGSLVKSFNKMTRDLKTSQMELRKTNTELSKTSEEVESRRRYMEAVLNNVTAGIISIGKKGRIQTVNKAAANILKVEPNIIIGRSLKEVVDKPEHQLIVGGLLEELEASKEGSLKKTIHLKDIKGKKTEAVLLVSVEVLKDDSDKYMGMVVVFDDMTELIKAQRMAAWREVARRIAHEIKNPLTPIKLSAQRLRRKFVNKFENNDLKVFEECTKAIVDQTDDLKILVNEFSKFARLPEVKPEMDNLHELISEVTSIYRENHPNLSFEIMEKDKIPMFMFDKEQLKRVFLNLINNAINAISGSGVISIRTEYNPVLHIARVLVIDSGRGIPKELRNKMFEPYFSTKKSGTGLGLAIVNQIISDHNGYVRVEENKPQGTRFILEFPVSYSLFKGGEKRSRVFRGDSLLSSKRSERIT